MKIVWTKPGLRDLDCARDYIAEENPGAAARVIERIEEALMGLRRHPQIGRPGRVEATRELVVPGTPFILVYMIRAKRIEIAALIHGARQWPDAF